MSTGKKVNSALDNPSSYFTAQSLTSRADSLESLLDGMGQAVQTITAADDSITSLKTLVDQASALANNAKDTANTAATSTGDVDLRAVGNPAELGGVTAGDSFTIRLGDGDTVAGTKNVSLTQTMGDLGYKSTTATLSIKVGDNSFTSIVIDSGDTVEAVTKKINDNTRLKGLVTASVTDGKFTIESTDPKKAVTVRASIASGAASATAGTNVSTALGLDEGYTVTIAAHGNTVIAGGAIAGATSATTMSEAGVSPTPATIKISVGENTYSINFDADTDMSAAANEMASKTGLTVDFVAASGFTITDTEGRAVKVEDVTGNFAEKTGIATSDYVKPTTGGIEALVDDINELSTDIKAEIDKNGYLKISSLTGDQLTITDVANATGVTGTSASALGVSGLADNGTNTRKSYSEQFDSIMGQIDQMVTNGDTSYKGVNLLNGDDLTVNFNEDRTSSLLIKGSVLDSTGLGLGAAKNEWKSSADIDRALSDIDTASSRLETKASELGQNLSIIQTRQDFTENMVNTLTTGADDLTLADMNEEAANLLALQTRQQLATNALSLASQSQQSVLSLF